MPREGNPACHRAACHSVALFSKEIPLGTALPPCVRGLPASEGLLLAVGEGFVQREGFQSSVLFLRSWQTTPGDVILVENPGFGDPPGCRTSRCAPDCMSCTSWILVKFNFMHLYTCREGQNCWQELSFQPHYQILFLNLIFSSLRVGGFSGGSPLPGTTWPFPPVPCPRRAACSAGEGSRGLLGQ